MKRRWLLGAYALAAVLLSLHFVVDGALPNVVAPLTQEGGDGNVTLTCARLFRGHVDPYGEEWLHKNKLPHVGHPPSTPFWFLPFRRFDYKQAHGVFGMTSLILLFTLLLLVAAELRAPLLPVTVVLAFAFVIDCSWLRYHLAMMQLGIPIALLMVLGWLFLRRGQELEAGAMLGLACTIKFFPGVMMIFLVVARRFRALAAAAVAWLAVAGVMTWGYGGIQCWPEYFSKGKETADYWLANIKNGSLHAVVLRAFFPACHPHFGTLPLATFIATLLSLALIGGSVYLCRRLARQQALLDGPYALFATVAVFVNPVVWEHYYVLLILPVAVAAWLLVGAAREGLARWKTALGATALAGVVWASALEIQKKVDLQKAGPSAHLRMHLYEVANWIVWPLLILVLGALVFRLDRSSSRRA